MMEEKRERLAFPRTMGRLTSSWLRARYVSLRVGRSKESGTSLEKKHSQTRTTHHLARLDPHLILFSAGRNSPFLCRYSHRLRSSSSLRRQPPDSTLQPPLLARRRPPFVAHRRLSQHRRYRPPLPPWPTEAVATRPALAASTARPLPPSVRSSPSLVATSPLSSSASSISVGSGGHPARTAPRS